MEDFSIIILFLFVLFLLAELLTRIFVKEAARAKWYVLHAEANAISKVASSTQSCVGATLYITLSPCRECSKLIHQAGIKRLVYHEQYKDGSGLDFLQKAGVETTQISKLS